eukprot:10287764-Alexandrium_andersonii.AAC.1
MTSVTSGRRLAWNLLVCRWHPARSRRNRAVEPSKPDGRGAMRIAVQTACLDARPVALNCTRRAAGSFL